MANYFAFMQSHHAKNRYFMANYYVYILRSLSKQSLYIGSTQNPDVRLNAHNDGKVISTKSFRPWISIWLEEFDSSANAFKREKYLKSG